MDKIDSEFLRLCERIQYAYTTLSRAGQIRVELWTRAMSEESVNDVWRKNRNLHAKLLLRCVIANEFVPPFDRKPPNEPIGMLPPETALSLTLPRRRKQVVQLVNHKGATRQAPRQVNRIQSEAAESPEPVNRASLPLQHEQVVLGPWYRAPQVVSRSATAPPAHSARPEAAQLRVQHPDAQWMSTDTASAGTAQPLPDYCLKRASEQPQAMVVQLASLQEQVSNLQQRVAALSSQLAAANRKECGSSENSAQLGKASDDAAADEAPLPYHYRPTEPARTTEPLARDVRFPVAGICSSSHHTGQKEVASPILSSRPTAIAVPRKASICSPPSVALESASSFIQSFSMLSDGGYSDASTAWTGQVTAAGTSLASSVQLNAMPTSTPQGRQTARTPRRGQELSRIAAAAAAAIGQSSLASPTRSLQRRSFPVNHPILSHMGGLSKRMQVRDVHGYELNPDWNLPVAPMLVPGIPTSR